MLYIPCLFANEVDIFSAQTPRSQNIDAMLFPLPFHDIQPHNITYIRTTHTGLCLLYILYVLYVRCTAYIFDIIQIHTFQWRCRWLIDYCYTLSSTCATVQFVIAEPKTTRRTTMGCPTREIEIEIEERKRERMHSVHAHVREMYQ